MTPEVLCVSVLCIWSWSLMQFTIIITGNKNKALNLKNATACEKAKEICCNADVWGILINIILQVITRVVLLVLKFFMFICRTLPSLCSVSC